MNGAYLPNATEFDSVDQVRSLTAPHSFNGGVRMLAAELRWRLDPTHYEVLPRLASIESRNSRWRRLVKSGSA